MESLRDWSRLVKIVSLVCLGRSRPKCMREINTGDVLGA